MAVPSEILKLLEFPPQAHAALACSLHGPIGETHLVVANGALLLFTRESLIGEFARVALDPTRPPSLEAGDFSDTLHLQLSDGASYQLNVSSFEREDVASTLLAAAAPPSQAARPDPVLDVPPPMPETQFQATASLAPATPTAEPTTPAEPDPEDDQAEKEPAVYEGSTLRLMPCLTMILLFFGPVVAMWFLHEQAMHALALMAPGEYTSVGFIFVTTKILALVSGIYATVKLLGLLTRLGRARNWDGHVIFDRDGVKMVGPGNKWEVAIDRSRPFDLACECHAAEPQGQTDAKTEHIYYLRLAQRGAEATLRTTFHAASIESGFAGVPVVRVGSEKAALNTLATDEKVFRRVAARLRKMREPFAKAASAGDNGVA